MMGLNITTKQVLSYTLLPQIAPRMHEILYSGFSQLAYFIALVYRAMNILPNNHPYLQYSSVGKYGIRNVLAEAAGHIHFDLKNIDKTIVFFSIVAGLIILFLQFFILIATMFTNPAFAGGLPGGIGEYFITPAPAEDLALRMLDHVFGIPQIFGSRELTGGELPVHFALHGLFQMYSFGLLVIGVIIVIYFIFAILAETAQSGTPFGKRYNHVWAPIRLVAGIGMLVPITLGINSAQWITLYAAKLGSGFATTGWILFNDIAGDRYIPPEESIGQTKVPSLKDIAAFMTLAHACQHGYFTKTRIQDIRMWFISGAGADPIEVTAGTDVDTLITEAGNRDLIFRIGQRDAAAYTNEKFGVRSHCGDIVLPNTLPAGSGADSAGQIMMQAYVNLLIDMWTGANFGNIRLIGVNIMERHINNTQAAAPSRALKQPILDSATEQIAGEIPDAVQEGRDSIPPRTDPALYGWGGASLWYNEIANANGQVATSIINKPVIKQYPAPMEFACKENKQQNNQTPPDECYDTNLTDGQKVFFINKMDENIAKGLSATFDYWYKDPQESTSSLFIDVINTFLGLNGLFEMCENADIHPLAQLSTLGKGLIDAAIRNLGIAIGSGAGSIISGFLGPTLNAASTFFSSLVSIGLLLGFILYYVVPFLPFLYFMFAVGGWVKGIFEAMVGVPLWALAHLRIDGEGLPGDAAINGYFLIFEIFVRPLLIIFGLIASFLIFGAMVKVLHDIFSLVVANITGKAVDAASIGTGGCTFSGIQTADTSGMEYVRGPVDEFFFTVIYAIIVYMIGMTCFKLIDQIPNNILRWMGQGVHTFADQAGEPAEGLLSKIAIGGSMLSQNMQIAGKAKEAATGVGLGVARMMGTMKQ